MVMGGKNIMSLQEMKKNFRMDELICGFCSGELEIWLRKIGEKSIADKVSAVVDNGYSLSKLYEILRINPNLTESEVRNLI